METLFEHGFIQVVCTTSTLALGVNLPVYLVVIKGTVQWKGGGKGYEELSDAMLQQMVGRDDVGVERRLDELDVPSLTSEELL